MVDSCKKKKTSAHWQWKIKLSRTRITYGQCPRILFSWNVLTKNNLDVRFMFSMKQFSSGRAFVRDGSSVIVTRH